MKKFGLLVGATVLLCVACGQQAAQAAKEITLAQYTEKANALTAEVYSSAVATMSATYNGQSASVSLNYTYSEATGWVANATTEQEKAAAQSIDKIIGEQAKELAAAAAMTPATLGYTFPKNMIRRIGLESLRIYANLQNLLTITDYSGYDPEIGVSTASVNVMGLDNGRYPSPTTYSFGLNVSF